MKKGLLAGFFLLLALSWGAQALANELALYREASKALGSQDKVLLASGSSRMVIWKDRSAPNEVGIILLGDPRKYPEETFYSFPGYFVSSNGVSPRSQQCSWWRITDRRSIIYACGIAMKQNGKREMVTPDMVADLTTMFKDVKPVPVTGQRDFIELVYLIRPSSKSAS